MAGGDMGGTKRRIKSIESIIKITNAMKLVSTSKLRRARFRLEQTKPFFDEIYKDMIELAVRIDIHRLQYVHKGPSPQALYIVIGGDRGLAGGFNLNLFKKIVERVDKENTIIFPIGNIAISFFKKNGFKITGGVANIGEKITSEKAYHMAARMLYNYNNNLFSEIYLAYTSFLSTLSQEPTIKKILPLDFGKSVPAKSSRLVYYEPNTDAVFRAIVPQYFAGMLYGGMIESFAAEQAARSNAMESATGNAKRIIDDLTLQYNRARQFAITTEIIEIVSGAAS